MSRSINTLRDWTVRDYTADDRSAVEACFRELQEFERRIDSHRTPADAIVEPYVDWVLEQCRQKRGHVYVADIDGQVVAFLSVWVEPSLTGLLSTIRPIAYISDLVVSEAYRRRGIGTALLARAEEYAAATGVSHLVLRVLSASSGARQTYYRFGFADHDVRLIKPVAQPPRPD